MMDSAAMALRTVPIALSDVSGTQRQIGGPIGDLNWRRIVGSRMTLMENRYKIQSHELGKR